MNYEPSLDELEAIAKPDSLTPDEWCEIAATEYADVRREWAAVATRHHYLLDTQETLRKELESIEGTRKILARRMALSRAVYTAAINTTLGEPIELARLQG